MLVTDTETGVSKQQGSEQNYRQYAALCAVCLGGKKSTGGRQFDDFCKIIPNVTVCALKSKFSLPQSDQTRRPLKPTQPPIQSVPRLFTIDKTAGAWSARLHLPLMLRMSGGIPTFPACLHGMNRGNFTLYYTEHKCDYGVTELKYVNMRGNIYIYTHTHAHTHTHTHCIRYFEMPESTKRNSSSSSSLSSCIRRVRRVSCSLILKLKLVPP